ncbi:MAG: glycosyltransferase family 2 protein [bacterium]|nr:glycosyltransferase family 2 protein [Candidatus Kapabacteria bacterium]
MQQSLTGFSYPTDSLPDIAVGLLSFNRADEVLRTLELFDAIDYPSAKLHLVVIDNASSDGTADRVRQRFGDRVEIVRLDENIGAIARNQSILGRPEKYIFQFDEDTAPADPTTIRDAVEWFDRHPHVGALCFRSLNVHTGMSDWGPLEKFASRRLPDGSSEGIFAIGNGMGFRRDAVQRTMGYDPRIFWGAEELHFGLELLYNNITIAYHPGLVIVHRQLPRVMPRAQVVEQEVRNNIRAYMIFMPAPLGIAMSLLHCARRLAQAAKHSDNDHAVATFRGAGRAIRERRDWLPTRRPIPMSRFAANNRWVFLTFIGLPASRRYEGDADRVARTQQALERLESTSTAVEPNRATP